MPPASGHGAERQIVASQGDMTGLKSWSARLRIDKVDEGLLESGTEGLVAATKDRANAAARLGADEPEEKFGEGIALGPWASGGERRSNGTAGDRDFARKSETT